MIPDSVNHPVSKKVLCCKAKTWSVVIGWLQTVLTAISIAIFAYWIMRNHEFTLRTDHDIQVIKILALILIPKIVQLVGGIFLIVGVHQQRVCKIQIWIAIQILFLVFNVLLGIVNTIRGGSPQQIMQEVIEILINHRY